MTVTQLGVRVRARWALMFDYHWNAIDVIRTPNTPWNRIGSRIFSEAVSASITSSWFGFFRCVLLCSD